MQHLKVTIDGMSCGGCVSTVEKALRAVPGIRVDAVDVGSATVSYDATRTTPAAIAQAITSAGYEPHSSGTSTFAAAPRAMSGGCCSGETINSENSEGKKSGGSCSCSG